MKPKDGELHDLYRAIVVDVNDPERRNRVRVHVFGVNRYKGHTSRLEDGTFPPFNTEGLYAPMDERMAEFIQQGEGEADTSGWASTVEPDVTAGLDTYPWAEVMTAGSKFAGFHSPLMVGDRVWVEYEYGDVRYPVVTGSWINTSGGASDYGAEVSLISDTLGGSGSSDCETPDYITNRRRWVWKDRRANMIELSELNDENWVRLKSGAAALTLSNTDDSFRFETPGTFGVESESVSARSTGAFYSAESEMIFDVCGDGEAGGYVALWGAYSSQDAELFARDQLAIGQYLRREAKPEDGSTKIRSTVEQTRFAFIAPEALFLGLSCPEMFDAFTTYSDRMDATIDPENLFEATKFVRMEATNWIAIHAGQDPPSVSGSQSGSNGGDPGYMAIMSGPIEPLTSYAIAPLAGDYPLAWLRTGDLYERAGGNLFLFGDYETWFSPGATVFPVLLTKDDGTGGDGTTYADFKYTVRRMDSNRVIGTGIEVITGRPYKGTLTEATWGFAVMRKDTPGIGLMWVNEVSTSALV